MGTRLHHAIVVTSWSVEDIRQAYDEAARIFSKISSIIHGTHNGYASFFIPPDGSDEGREASNSGDRRRDDFIKLLELYPNVTWAEAQYGSDSDEPEHGNKLTRCSGVPNDRTGTVEGVEGRCEREE